MAAELFSDWEATTAALREVSWDACEVQDRLVSQFIDRLSERQASTPKHVDIARVLEVLTPENSFNKRRKLKFFSWRKFLISAIVFTDHSSHI